MSDFEINNPAEELVIVDTGGNPVKVTNGGLDINIQDQHTKSFDIYFSQLEGSPTTLTTDAVIDAWSISATTGHGLVVGSQIVLFDTVSSRLYIGNVLVAGANILDLDTPLNFSYPSASSVLQGSTKELNVNGAVTRQTFSIQPPVDLEIDVTRVMFKMITTGFPELDMFGDIAGGITRGIVLRVVNGENINLFNVKTNGELVNLMYDVQFYEAAKHGVNGLGGRLTYAGRSKHGVTLRLGQGDSLEVIIQDDLTSLASFRMIASGHVVE